MRKVKRGDEVIVITGKDKGRRGRVLRLVPDERVVVQDINMIKKHIRPNPQRGITGGIVEREASIHISNVMLFNPQTGRGDRVGFRLLADGRKVRYFKSTNEVVDL